MGTEPLTRDLPYENTLGGLREKAARDAYQGQEVYGRLLREVRAHSDQYAPEEIREQMMTALSAANYGWSLAAVLGWLAKEHPKLAYRAGCIAEDVMINGGSRWCDDLWPVVAIEGGSDTSGAEPPGVDHG